MNRETNPFECYLRLFNSSSYQEMYFRLKIIAKYQLGLDRIPFPLSVIENPSVDDMICPEIHDFLVKCGKVATGNESEEDAIKLIRLLKDNPPEESYENPRVSNSRPPLNEGNLMVHIFYYGIDLPGSKHNPFGHLQYFSSFFIDIFFGNYTEFKDHIKSLSKEELDRAMKKREGYCQQSPIFAPILGLNMVDIESKWFTDQQIKEIRTMYSGCNEHKHLKILKKLIRLGADVNAHDINGFTPLQHAVKYQNEGMITVLLKHGANPNSESRVGLSPLYPLRNSSSECQMNCIDVLIQHNARLFAKDDINELRASVENHGPKHLAIKVREAHPRGNKECEKCGRPTSKQCGACGKVYYCTPYCQKLDWKFHKITCLKKVTNVYI